MIGLVERGVSCNKCWDAYAVAIAFWCSNLLTSLIFLFAEGMSPTPEITSKKILFCKPKNAVFESKHLFIEELY